MNKKHHIDYFLFAGILALLVLGIIALSSAASVYSQKETGQTSYYFIHQLIYGTGIGLFLGLIAFFIPLNFYKKNAVIFIFITLGLMLLVFVPGIGINVNGAPRWLNLKFTTFQPAELLKLAFIIYLSAWLAKPKEKKKHWKETFLAFLIIIGFIAGILYFQSDAGTLGIIFFVALSMYFLSSTPFWQTASMVLLGFIGLFFFVIFTPYRLNRIKVMWESLKDPFLSHDPMGLGFQAKQALITIGSGGIVGAGLGASSQKMGQYLPHIMSDSIFTVYAEETGFIGCLILIGLFLFIFWRGIKIAKESHDKFSQLFAIGVSSWFCFQAFLNIGSMIGIMPLVGVPLPFMSYGGSHIIAELVASGILLNISRYTNA